MRRVAVIFIGCFLSFVGAVGLVGCASAVSSVRPLDSGYSAEVAFESKDVAYTCTLVCQRDGTHTYAVVKPAHLADFTLVFAPDGTVRSVYRGLTYDPGVDFLPYGGPIQTLERALRHSVREGETTYENKEYRVSGRAQETAYCLVISPGGLPLRLDADGYTYVFSQVTLSEENAE